MEFFCVRSKRCYHLKKKPKSESSPRPSSTSGSKYRNEGQCINQIIVMASPPNAYAHAHPGWNGPLPLLPHAIHHNSPFSSRRPSSAYPYYPVPHAEGVSWETAEAPGTRPAGYDSGGTTEESTSRKPKKPAAKKGGGKKQHKSLDAPAPSYASQSMATQEVYIYPWSTPHISFPIVDYSKGRRARHSWPAFYMAIAPNCATCHDFEEVLAPPASNLVVIARTSPKGEGRPLQSFGDIVGLRNETFQLEIWDEHDEASGSSKEATK